MTVTGLYIENGYYFAARPIGGGGSVGDIAATTAAVAAHFNVTTIPSPAGTNEQFGHNVSAGDLNGDGISDLAVATTNGGKAYLFLGGSTLPSTPSVTFTGAVAAFGFNVTIVGDVDHDGFEDLAIADATVNKRIYLYKGRASWPAALTDTQADYVISTDASYTGTFFGFSMARLGDFTGDGVDDFAISARSYASNVGRVVIIPGLSGSFQQRHFARRDLAAITIDGDAALGQPAFGYRVLGIGHFYSGAGTTLIVSAPGTTASATANPGRVYAFHGQTGSGEAPYQSRQPTTSSWAQGRAPRSAWCFQA